MFEEDINLINQRLYEMIADYKEIKPFLEYALFPGGKRLRPLLVLSMLKDMNIDVNVGLDIACAIEFIHTYSLIHDDLPAMDNDEMRRNKLTVHVAYGEANAILAGDALLTEAFYWLANAKLQPEKKLKIISLIARFSGANGMIRGQLLDISNKSLEIDDIEEIHVHKTTDLFSCAILSAAVIGDQNLDAWHEFALNFGKAYQIKDDLEDIDKEETTTIVKAIGVEASMTKFIAFRAKSLEIVEKLIGKEHTYRLVENVI